MSKWVRGLRRVGFVLIVSSTIVALSSVAAQAQTFKITNLTNGNTKASFPNWVVDAKKNTYLAWVDTVQKGIVVGSKFDGTNFTAAALIPTATLPAFQPQIAVDTTSGTGPNVEVVWASLSSASTTTSQVYDVFAARSNDGGATFPFITTTPISSAPGAPGPVPLADSPRVAFDGSGRVNVVWGQNGVWISQSAATVDGTTFPSATSLFPPNPPVAQTTLNTGGPRIAVDSFNDIFVAWTDIANKDAAGSYCTSPLPPAGTPVTATVGGNVWMNETLQNGSPDPAKTRNLSNTDWFNVNPDPGKPQTFPNGFFGCSYDNLTIFTEHNLGTEYVHLLWSNESPIEDILFSKSEITAVPHLYTFSFPINLASTSAASPQVAVGTNSNGDDSIYVVWSGGPTGGKVTTANSTNSQGIFFSRSDHTGDNFTSPALSIADPTAVAPAYPRVAVDSSGNVSVAWEQVDQPQPLNPTSDTFHVYFAHSTDKGNTFPTVVQASTDPSFLCFNDNSSANTSETTPDNTTCGTVQLGLDANSNPDMAWVSQASSTASTADIDFATTNLTAQLTPDFSLAVSPNPATAGPGQTVNFMLNATSTGTLPAPIALTCTNLVSVSKTTITCPSLSASSISGGQSASFSVSVPGSAAQGDAFSFTLNGTSGTTTHRVLVTLNVGNPMSPGSVSPSSQTITGVNSSANFNITINPSFFSGPITFSCLDADTNGQPPSWLGCTFNPQPLDPTKSNSDVLTVTEKSTPTKTSGIFISAPRALSLPGYAKTLAWSVAMAMFGLMSLTMLAIGRRRQLKAAVVMRGLLVMTLTIVLAAGLVSCGGSTSTPASSSGGSSGSGGSGGGGGTNAVTVHIAVMAQSGNATPVNLGTVTITAQ